MNLIDDLQFLQEPWDFNNPINNVFYRLVQCNKFGNYPLKWNDHRVFDNYIISLLDFINFRNVVYFLHYFVDEGGNLYDFLDFIIDRLYYLLDHHFHLNDFILVVWHSIFYNLNLFLHLQLLNYALHFNHLRLRLNLDLHNFLLNSFLYLNLRHDVLNGNNLLFDYIHW